MAWQRALLPLVLAFSLGFFASSVRGAPASFLKGRVVDDTGAALPAVTVIVRDERGVTIATVVTDPEGAFHVPDLLPGSYVVHLSLAGFAPRTQAVDVPLAGLELELTLKLSGMFDAVVVTASRGLDSQSLRQIPQGASVVTSVEIPRRPTRTFPDVLREEPGIHVQQTTLGQGSPIIRGLTGRQVLTLVNGIRLNNATFRNGPNQYLSTIDPYEVERVEIIRGPASVLYGSDALGGVINIITRKRGYTDALQTGGRLLTKWGTADVSGLAGVDWYASSPRWVLNVNSFGQRVNGLRAGDGRYTRSAFSRFVTNDARGTPGRQNPTGFTQHGLSASLQWRLGDTQDLTLGYQRYYQYHVPRFDQVEGGNGRPHFSFPLQGRDLLFVDYDKQGWGFLDHFNAKVSYHSQPEQRRIQSFTSQGALGNITDDRSDTNTLGFIAQGRTHWGGRQALTLGGEVYLDDVTAANRILSRAGAVLVRDVRGRFPKDSRFRTYGLFLQDDVQLTQWLTGTFGARYSAFQLRIPNLEIASFLSAIGVTAPGLSDQLSQSFDDLTGSAGVVVSLNDDVNLDFHIGRAFRAPNINDFGLVGLTSAGFEIPGRGLRPESLLSYEVGIRGDWERVGGSVNLFDSELSNFVHRVRTTLGGLKEIAGSPLFTSANVGKARMMGYEAAGRVRVTRAYSVWATWFHVAGRDITNADFFPAEAGVPPPQGWLGLRWEPSGRRYWLEGFSNVARPQRRLSQLDIQEQRLGAFRTFSQIRTFRLAHGIPLAGGPLPDGRVAVPIQEIADTPFYTQTDGYYTLNLRGGLRLSENYQLLFLLENLLDRNYRVHGSGIDAPGLNASVTLEYRF